MEDRGLESEWHLPAWTEDREQLRMEPRDTSHSAM